MKILLKNTVEGLKPLYDDDYDEKKKLRIGEVYEADLKPMKPRNLQFHRKYFALINCAWDCLTEEQAQFFHRNVENESLAKEHFRSYLQIQANHFQMMYDPKTNLWVHVSESISFRNMNETEFEQLYKDVKDAVLVNIVAKNKDLSEEVFMEILTNY